VSFLEAHAGRPLARISFWATSLFVLVIALWPMPPAVAVDVSDKIQHAAAFATLALLALWAFPRSSAVWIVAGLSLFGAFIEVAQGTPLIHRDMDVFDWVADTVACALVVLALRWFVARKR
jgi:hypothetical protein